jgi:hypothetical protein
MKRLTLLLLLCLGMMAAAAPIEAQQSGCHPYTQSSISFSASGDQTIVAANSDRQIVIWQFFLVNSDASTDTSITLKDGSTSKSGAYLLKANGGSHTAPCTGTPWLVTTAGSAAVFNSSAAANVRGTVYWSYQ